VIVAVVKPCLWLYGVCADQYDAVRINQLYQQAKWSILSQEINSSLDDGLVFAALQVSVLTLSVISLTDDLSMLCDVSMVWFPSISWFVQRYLHWTN